MEDPAEMHEFEATLDCPGMPTERVRGKIRVCRIVVHHSHPEPVAREIVRCTGRIPGAGPLGFLGPCTLAIDGASSMRVMIAPVGSDGFFDGEESGGAP